MASGTKKKAESDLNPDDVAAAEVSKADGVLSGKFVRYIGTADIRDIDMAGWKNADVNGMESSGAFGGKKVWSAKNRHRIPVEEFSDDALAYLHEVDDGFVVDGATGDE